MKVAFDQISDFAQFVSADYSNNSSCQPQDQRLTVDLRTKFVPGLQAHLSNHMSGDDMMMLRMSCAPAAATFRSAAPSRRPVRVAPVSPPRQALYSILSRRANRLGASLSLDPFPTILELSLVHI